MEIMIGQQNIYISLLFRYNHIIIVEITSEGNPIGKNVNKVYLIN